MIRRSLEDTLSKIKDKTVSVVDYEKNTDGKLEWIIREMDKSKALELFDKRLSAICTD